MSSPAKIDPYPVRLEPVGALFASPSGRGAAPREGRGVRVVMHGDALRGHRSNRCGDEKERVKLVRRSCGVVPRGPPVDVRATTPGGDRATPRGAASLRDVGGGAFGDDELHHRMMAGGGAADPAAPPTVRLPRERSPRGPLPPAVSRGRRLVALHREVVDRSDDDDDREHRPDRRGSRSGTRLLKSTSCSPSTKFRLDQASGSRRPEVRSSGGFARVEADTAPDGVRN